MSKSKEKEFKNIELEFKKVFFTGLELMHLKNKKELRISETDGNMIQRTFNEWSDEKADLYIKSLKKKFPHTPFYLIYFRDSFYVVDGQHRIMHILKHIKNEKYKDKFKLSKQIFEFILVKNKMENEEDLVKLGAYIFRILNDESSEVKNGSIYKAAMRSKALSKSLELYDIFVDTFKTAKIKKSQDEINTDRVYEVLGILLTTLNNKATMSSSDDITKLVRKLLEELTKAKLSKLIDSLITILHEMKTQKCFANPNNVKTNLPTKKYLVPLICAYAHDNSFGFNDMLIKLNDLFNSISWKESKRKSRSSAGFSLSTKALIHSMKDPSKTIEDHFNAS